MNDTKGKQSFVIAGVWKNQSMESDTVNQIKSVYPLDDLEEIIKAASKRGSLVITNKNKVEKMLHTISVQPAEVSHILNLAKESISQPNDSVNSQTSEKSSSQADADMYKSLIEKYGAIEPGEKQTQGDDSIVLSNISYNRKQNSRQSAIDLYFLIVSMSFS